MSCCVCFCTVGQRTQVSQMRNNFERNEVSRKIENRDSSSFSSNKCRKHNIFVNGKASRPAARHKKKNTWFLCQVVGSTLICVKHNFRACRSWIGTKVVRATGGLFKWCWQCGDVYSKADLAETKVLQFLVFGESSLDGLCEVFCEVVQRSTAGKKKSISECYMM